MKRKSGLSAEPAKYRELLLATRSELLAKVGSGVPRLSELGRLADDDQAQAAHEQFISLEVQQRYYRTVKEVDAALDRLLTGDYGVCLGCGQPINPRRLAVVPWASRCVRCQENIGEHVEELDERAA